MTEKVVLKVGLELTILCFEGRALKFTVYSGVARPLKMVGPGAYKEKELTSRIIEK